ncbi:MAG: hypothetical protein MZW92_46275 [Comamonadaceae bacterium]|nr:hypothetical protein [Comamonadaceae bacterium]
MTTGSGRCSRCMSACAPAAACCSWRSVGTGRPRPEAPIWPAASRPVTSIPCNRSVMPTRMPRCAPGPAVAGWR